MVLALIYIGVGFCVGVLVMLPYAGDWRGWKRAIPYVACVTAGVILALAVSLPLWMILDRMWAVL